MTITSELETDTDTSITIDSIKQYTHHDKKKLAKRITHLKLKQCYIEIFKLISTSSIEYSKNDNGIFFDLTLLNNALLQKIENIIYKYEKKKIQFLTKLEDSSTLSEKNNTTSISAIKC